MIGEITIVIMIMIEVNQEVMVFNQIKAFLDTHDSSISDEEAYKKYAKCKLEFNLCCLRHF